MRIWIPSVLDESIVFKAINHASLITIHGIRFTEIAHAYSMSSKREVFPRNYSKFSKVGTSALQMHSPKQKAPYIIVKRWNI